MINLENNNYKQVALEDSSYKQVPLEDSSYKQVQLKDSPETHRKGRKFTGAELKTAFAAQTSMNSRRENRTKIQERHKDAAYPIVPLEGDRAEVKKTRRLGMIFNQPPIQH